MKKIALVTAGHKGLGFGWSQYLASRGYVVVIAGRAREAIDKAAAKVRESGGEAHGMLVDVASEESIAALARQVSERFGHVDLLVNNAGVNPKDYPDKEKARAGFNLAYLDPEVLIEVYRINSIGPLIMVKHFKPLLEKGKEKTVLNISSWLGSVTNLSFGGHYGYVSSKNLLNVLNKSMGLEIKESGIKCLNVNPGWVKTAMGGSKAQFTPMESADMVYSNVIERASVEDTGKFYNYDGSAHAW